MPKRKAPKRGNNAGTVSRRKDGRWEAKLLVGYDENGKPKRRTFYGKTREEAEGKLLDAMRDHRKGLLLEPSRQTVGDYLTAWLEDCVKGSARPRTHESYGQVLRHIIPAIGAVQLTKLTPQHLQRLYRQKQDAGLTRMVLLIHAVLHKSLGQAVKWNLVPRNVADAVERPKVAKQEFRALSPEEADRFLDAAQEDRLHAMYVLAVTCGLRQGELLGLKWEDINFDAGTLTVRRQLQWLKVMGKQQPTFAEPKSSKSRRTVALPAFAVAALKKHKVRQAEDRLRLMGTWPAWGLVFCTTIGTPLNPSGVRQRSFHLLLKRAGLPHIRFHDLRHTCATLLLGQGVHPKLVQETLGHSQISMTLDTYSHVTAPMMKAAAAQMDAILMAAKAKRR